MGLVEWRARPDGLCPHRASEPEGGGDPLMPDEVGGVAGGTSYRDVAGIVPASRGAHCRPLHPRLASLCSGHRVVHTINNRIMTYWRVSAGTPVRGTSALRGGGCPGRDRERDPGRIPRSDVAQRDAAVWNGSDRILSHGAPPWRMTPNGCLGNPAIVSLPS